MNITEAIETFRKNYIGTTVRAQVVECVEITVEVFGNDAPRWFLRAIFRENPASGDSPENDLLQRIYSDIPRSAFILCKSWDDAVRIITREDTETIWRLEDEAGIVNK